MGNDLSKGKVLTVDTSTIKIKRLLGEGGFAHVYLATLLDVGSVVVLKRMRISTDDVDGINLARQEIRVLKGLPRHEHVVSFIAAQELEVNFSTGPEKYVNFDILMENCSGGSVYDEVVGFSKRGEHFPEARLLRRFREAALAVAHLHSQPIPICHRDIKPGWCSLMLPCIR